MSNSSQPKINPAIIVAIAVALAVVIVGAVVYQSGRPDPEPTPSATGVVTATPEPFTQTTVMGHETAWLDASYSSGDVATYFGTGVPIALTSDRSAIVITSSVELDWDTEEVTGGLTYVSLETGEVLDTLEGVDCHLADYMGGGSLYCLANPRLEDDHKVQSIVRVDIDSREVTTLLEPGRATTLRPFADRDGVVYALLHISEQPTSSLIAFDHDGELLWETDEDVDRCVLGDGFIGCTLSFHLVTFDSGTGTKLASIAHDRTKNGWCIDGAYASSVDDSYVVYDKSGAEIAVYEDVKFPRLSEPHSLVNPVLFSCDDVLAIDVTGHPSVEAIDIEGNVVLTQEDRTYTFSETGASLPKDMSSVTILGLTADGSTVFIEDWFDDVLMLVDNNGTVLARIPEGREVLSRRVIGGYLVDLYRHENLETGWTAYVPRPR